MATKTSQLKGIFQNSSLEILHFNRCKSNKYHNKMLKPHSNKDSLFSSGKPKNFPWFYIPVIIGVIALVIIFKWFD